LPGRSHHPEIDDEFLLLYTKNKWLTSPAGQHESGYRRKAEATMKRMCGLAVAVMAIVFLTAPSGPMGHRGGPGGMGGGSGMVYNTQTTVTISGVVKSVQRVTPGGGKSYDVYLIVQTSDAPLEVYLGPGWYIDSRDMKIQEGDTIEVKGSKVNYKGEPSIIAAEVTRGGDVLVLRDTSNGTAVWVGSKSPDQL
jgi:hypothetical protein